MKGEGRKVKGQGEKPFRTRRGPIRHHRQALVCGGRVFEALIREAAIKPRVYLPAVRSLLFFYSAPWKKTYSRRHSGHLIMTLSSYSPQMPILVPQESHLRQSSNPRNQGGDPPRGFMRCIAPSSFSSEGDAAIEIALCLPTKFCFAPFFE